MKNSTMKKIQTKSDGASTPDYDYHANRLLVDKIDKPDTLLLRLRRHLKISQVEMARELNVHEDTVRRIESGKQHPSKWVLPLIQKLAARHGVR